jgi:anti-sigma-K factor RskA
LVRQPGQVLTVAEAVLLVAATSAVVTLAVILAVLKRRQLSPVAVHALAAEVSVDQLVRSDTTTEAAERLLLGHTNSAGGETNR